MLSKKTKYGLKALAYIAQKTHHIPVAVSEISQAENISKKYLEAILLDLKKAEILNSKKGKTGGYYLLKTPKDIKLSEVIRTLEGPIAMLPCVSLNFYEKCKDCPSESECLTHKLMLQVRDSTLKILEENTLEDFINPKKRNRG